MFTKITNAELNSRGATTLANQPTISPQALKEEFDAPAKNIIAPHFNALIDELEATTAAASIGAVAPTGQTGATVQAVLNSLASETADIETRIPEDSAEIQDAIAKRHTHANKALLDTYSQTEANLADAVAKRHSHSNKDLLDTYTQTNTDIASAVANSHSHSNKALLDTYTQTESDLAGAVSNSHSHSNKSLLDTYEQTETNLADAVTKKHSHSNKSVLDKFSESQDGDPLYNGEPIGGGGGGGGGINYTTTEQNTGLTWIDSKPVYQKTIKQEFDPSTQVNSFYIDNIETIIDFEAIIESIKTSDPNNDRFYYPIPWYSSSSYYATIHSSVTATTPTRTEFRLIQAGFKPSSTSPARTLSLILTVRYTKRS